MAIIRKCYLCNSSKLSKVPGSVRDKPELFVKRCCNCGLLFLSSFDHINEELYRFSGMHQVSPDINQWLIDTENDDQRRYEYCLPIVTGKKVLDFGCGNGGFLIRIRDKVKSLMGVDLEKALSGHFGNQAIPFADNLDQINEKYDVITLFHVLEHLTDPSAMLKELKTFLKPGGQIIIEVPNANDALLTLYDSEAFRNFTYWSFHLFIFNAETLKLIFNRIGATTAYIKHIQRYSVSNHLHWLAKSTPGGHKKWSFLDSSAMTKCYEKELASLGMTDTLLASIYFEEI